MDKMINGVKGTTRWKWGLDDYLDRSMTRKVRNTRGRLSDLGDGLFIPYSYRHGCNKDNQNDIYVCVDVCGVSREKIREVLEEVYNIMQRKGKREVNLVYWSDTVDLIAPFSDKKKIPDIPVKENCQSDVETLFRFLKGEKVNGMKTQVEHYNGAYILIITDGKLGEWKYPPFFGDYKQYLNWVIVEDEDTN